MYTILNKKTKMYYNTLSNYTPEHYMQYDLKKQCTYNKSLNAFSNYTHYMQQYDLKSLIPTFPNYTFRCLTNVL